jgi:hypothetical protein
MLKGRRILLEPASKELRFADAALEPRIELDLANNKSVRIRVVFELNNRRFPLSSGAWFEGTPGWHIDTTDGVARPVSTNVTPAWLQRLYRSPALVQPMSELPRLLVEYVPRVCASLATALPDLSQVADVMDASPHFALRATGDIVGARARLTVQYDQFEYEVPPSGFPQPLAFQSPTRGALRPIVVRREVGAEMAAVQQLLDLGFVVDNEAPAGTTPDLVLQGDGAVAFWTTGIQSLPEEWERFVPNDLLQLNVRGSAIMPRARVSSGVDWLSLDMIFEAEGVLRRPRPVVQQRWSLSH